MVRRHSTYSCLSYRSAYVFIYLFVYLFIYLTNFIQQNSTWQSDSSSDSQQIPHVLWNPKVYHRAHNSLSLFLNLRQDESLSFHYKAIVILSSHLRQGLPNGVVSSHFPTKNMYYPSPPYVPNAQPITLLSLGDQHTTWKSSLRSSLQSPVTSSLKRPPSLSIPQRHAKPLFQFPLFLPLQSVTLWGTWCPRREDMDAEDSSLVMLIHICHSTRRHTPQRRRIEVFRINKEWRDIKAGCRLANFKSQCCL